MKTGIKGIDLIKSFEGFSHTPYLCSAKKSTIGYGHIIKDDEKDLVYVTKDQAIEILRKDLKVAEYWVNHFISAELNQNQFDALVSFTFNLGGGTLQRSSVRMAINRGDTTEAVTRWKLYCFAGGRKLVGLLRRRLAEIELYTDNYKPIGGDDDF